MLNNSKPNTYQYGNTVRFDCLFFDFNGDKVNPDLVKIIIYNSRHEILLEEIMKTENQRSIGEYFYDYVTEDKKQTVYYEWYGEINGKPSLKRGQIATNFM